MYFNFVFVFQRTLLLMVGQKKCKNNINCVNMQNYVNDMRHARSTTLTNIINKAERLC